MTAAVRNRASAFVLAVALAVPAGAGPLEDGLAAYREKEYAKAAELWQPLAEKGDATAQYSLANLYAEGKGVTQDDAKAFAWFEKAAKQGNAAAQYNVAASYAMGAGVPKNEAEAAKWFKRAAEQGMPVAQLNLGLLYAAGSGVAKDPVEAFMWLDIAFRGLPAGGPRMDVARAMTDVGATMTEEQVDAAKRRSRAWTPKPEGK